MKNSEHKNPNKLVGTLIALHLLLLVYSLSGFFSKNAAMQDFLSLPFILLYCGMLGILAIYAVGWQQIIKRMSLTLAFANKAITVVWGIVWGFLFFGEAVTSFKIFGAILIILGIVIFSIEDQKTASEVVLKNAASGSGESLEEKNADVSLGNKKSSEESKTGIFTPNVGGDK